MLNAKGEVMMVQRIFAMLMMFVFVGCGEDEPEISSVEEVVLEICRLILIFNEIGRQSYSLLYRIICY
mgnify:CR=1 FL=1|tara:strand:- start:366 stop:569 length:204 start_codon:yes stop_codon:yes gene_type:complete